MQSVELIAASWVVAYLPPWGSPGTRTVVVLPDNSPAPPLARADRWYLGGGRTTQSPASGYRSDLYWTTDVRLALRFGSEQEALRVARQHTGTVVALRLVAAKEAAC